MPSNPVERLATMHHHLYPPGNEPNLIQDVYILSAARTPCGAFNGALSNVSATELGAAAIKEAVSRSGVSHNDVGHVYMGNVLQAGLGQAPARQAAIRAGLPTSVEATTINKVCASGLKAVSIAAQQIELGQETVVVAGGMESMTRAPLYLARASQQPRFGSVKLDDGLLKDGLWDVYNHMHVGSCADHVAAKHNIDRNEQDDFAIMSYRRAHDAWKGGHFAEEIVPITVTTRSGRIVVKQDEGFDRLDVKKMRLLRPAFSKSSEGTVTAANSSPLTDGASALVLCNRDTAKRHGKSKPVLARLCAYADAATDPIDFPIAPSKVIPIVLKRAGITTDQVKIWELNEAFAAVITANVKVSRLLSAVI